MLLKPRVSWKTTSKRLWSATRKVFLKRIEPVKNFLAFCLLAIVLCQPLYLPELRAQGIAISYPGLTGESARLWMASDGGVFKENAIDSKLVYMEGGRLSIQSLLSGHTQFMSGDAVSAFTAVAGGADVVLLASAKSVLPYVFARSEERRV